MKCAVVHATSEKIVMQLHNQIFKWLCMSFSIEIYGFYTGDVMVMLLSWYRDDTFSEILKGKIITGMLVF